MTTMAPEAVGESDRACVLCGRLTVRPEAGRSRRCGGSEAKHGLALAGRVGVVREPLEIRRGGRRIRQRGKSLPVQR